MILLDTNILLRFADSVNPDCDVARNAVIGLRKRGEILSLVPQNIFEFWAVATRRTGSFATANGLGMSVNRVDQWLAYRLRNYPLFPDPIDLMQRWRILVCTFNVVGKKTHDTRLVAAMVSHGISSILTFNVDDFKRFPNISILDPRTIS